MVTWLSYIFPYRAHLETEIEYLRSQLSQKQRHIDELQSALIEKVTAHRVVRPVAEPRSSKPKVIRGWDAYRQESKRERKQEAEEESKEQPLSQGA